MDQELVVKSIKAHRWKTTVQAYKRAVGFRVVPPEDVVTDTYSPVVRAICHCGCDRSLERHPGFKIRHQINRRRTPPKYCWGKDNMCRLGRDHSRVCGALISIKMSINLLKVLEASTVLLFIVSSQLNLDLFTILLGNPGFDLFTSINPDQSRCKLAPISLAPLNVAL